MKSAGSTPPKELTKEDIAKAGSQNPVKQSYFLGRINDAIKNGDNDGWLERLTYMTPACFLAFEELVDTLLSAGAPESDDADTPAPPSDARQANLLRLRVACYLFALTSGASPLTLAHFTGIPVNIVCNLYISLSQALAEVFHMPRPGYMETRKQHIQELYFKDRARALELMALSTIAGSVTAFVLPVYTDIAAMHGHGDEDEEGEEGAEPTDKADADAETPETAAGSAADADAASLLSAAHPSLSMLHVSVFLDVAGHLRQFHLKALADDPLPDRARVETQSAAPAGADAGAAVEAGADADAARMQLLARVGSCLRLGSHLFLGQAAGAPDFSEFLVDVDALVYWRRHLSADPTVFQRHFTTQMAMDVMLAKDVAGSVARRNAEEAAEATSKAKAAAKGKGKGGKLSELTVESSRGRWSTLDLDYTEADHGYKAIYEAYKARADSSIDDNKGKTATDVAISDILAAAPAAPTGPLEEAGPDAELPAVEHIGSYYAKYMDVTEEKYKQMMTWGIFKHMWVPEAALTGDLLEAAAVVMSFIEHNRHGTEDGQAGEHQ